MPASSPHHTHLQGLLHGGGVLDGRHLHGPHDITQLCILQQLLQVFRGLALALLAPCRGLQAPQQPLHLSQVKRGPRPRPELQSWVIRRLAAPGRRLRLSCSFRGRCSCVLDAPLHLGWMVAVVYSVALALLDDECCPMRTAGRQTGPPALHYSAGSGQQARSHSCRRPAAPAKRQRGLWLLFRDAQDPGNQKSISSLARRPAGLRTTPCHGQHALDLLGWRQRRQQLPGEVGSRSLPAPPTSGASGREQQPQHHHPHTASPPRQGVHEARRLIKELSQENKQLFTNFEQVCVRACAYSRIRAHVQGASTPRAAAHPCRSIARSNTAPAACAA